MNDFVKGFIAGVKETPRGFFAPLIALWALLRSIAELALRRGRRPLR
ncbi:hypothetical protein [Rugamonas aquatica]|nr:hypothetical protein [Rugamonas aquatica]